MFARAVVNKSAEPKGKKWCILLWSTIHVGLMVNIIPGDDIVQAGGDGSPDGKDESPVKGVTQQPQDFLTLLTGWQEGHAGGATVSHSWVWMLRLLIAHNTLLKLRYTARSIASKHSDSKMHQFIKN